jgi:hypothetical protein
VSSARNLVRRWRSCWISHAIFRYCLDNGELSPQGDKLVVLTDMPAKPRTLHHVG